MYVRLKRLVNEIDVTKDSCIEGVSTRVLKIAFAQIVNAVSYLYTISLKTGISPRKWAIGYINIVQRGGR